MLASETRQRIMTDLLETNERQLSDRQLVTITKLLVLVIAE